MDKQLIFNFKTDISKIEIPVKFNNPFEVSVSAIARIAAKEFQEIIDIESKAWNYDPHPKKGKMFGVLVVQKKDNSFGYLGTNSGNLPARGTCDKFVPSIFDIYTYNFFINRGMSELTILCNEINALTDASEIATLKEFRSKKSFGLQQRLFENYHFLNINGKVQNTLQIFNNSTHGKPPAATGECTAPKLLQHAFKNNLKPIALAEFWWGNLATNKEREHKVFYPACKNKCRPILEYMLDDSELYQRALVENNHCKPKIK